MSLLWLIFFTVTIMLFQGWLYKKIGGHAVHYTRYFEAPAVFEGEEVQLTEKIANQKILPMPWIRVESKINSNLRFKKQYNLDIQHEQFHKSMFSLLPYTSIKRRHTIRCLKRGCYRLTSAALSYGDLFGMHESTKLHSFNTELLVYPRMIPLSDISLPSHSWIGDVAVRRWIVDDPFMMAGVKEYMPGDPLKNINWKASARAMRLQVHNYDYTADPRLMIYLNVESEEAMWDVITSPELIEKGISMVAAIAQYAIDRGVAVGVRSNGCSEVEVEEPLFIPAGSGAQHFDLILQALAKIFIKRTTTFYTLLEDDIQNRVTHTDMLLITAYLSPRMTAQSETLRQLGNAVEVLLLEFGAQEGGGGDQSIYAALA